MSSAIENIPPEVLDEVLSRLRPANGARYEDEVAAMETFKALCLSCKTLLPAVRKQLYHSVSLNSFELHQDSTRQLARTLCKASQLAFLIKEITVRWCARHTALHRREMEKQKEDREYSRTDYCHDEVGALEEHNPEDKEDFKKVLDSLPLDSKVRWKLQGDVSVTEQLPWFEGEFTELTGSCGGLEAMVVLNLATRAKKVLIEPWGSKNCPWWKGCQDLLEALWSRTSLARRPAGSYAALEEIEIDGMNPGLSFNGKICTDLKRLTFTQSQVFASTVVNAVRSVSGLEDFRLEVDHWGDDAKPPVGPFLAIEALRGALLGHSDTLHTLTITNLPNHGYVFRRQPKIGFLAELSTLRCLEIEEHLLVGHGGSLAHNTRDIPSILPRTLRKLVVHTYNDLQTLGRILLQLSPLRSRGLEFLKITFPVYWEEFMINGHYQLNTMHAPMFCTFKRDPSCKLRYSFGYGSYCGEERISMLFWDLNLWGASELERLAQRLIENRVADFIRDQRQGSQKYKT
ncbi:unnamed protein product [Zymoseptoria tritici ST99CH_1A5]|uniref:Uncharacterized protein n=1 Tax=Zymoseptoria tritici ST99CH_1A5 TaxID=1276529 RepID=A0A1Y6LSZ6_ZYMTR|nr:unnamed protein product [Zymoseptoria tritici ST99CH_1A5]